ncbi:Sodium/hydrogen exchanger family-domain-containing protein, partial [Syncephalis fuscata]
KTNNHGGLLQGNNPIAFNSENMLALFTLQICLIIGVTRLLQYPASLIRQPRAVAEIVGGILLGPTALGRIPGFSSTLFPEQSLPLLDVSASVGLIFFLTMIGLGISVKKMIRNAKKTIVISMVGLILPFSLGVVMSFLLASQLSTEAHERNFGAFLFFCGISMSITALPLLARIMSELGLLKTPLGPVVIGAAAVIDTCARCLMVFFTAFTHTYAAHSGAYVLLVTIAYALILSFVVRPLLINYFLPRFYNPDTGPSQLVVTAVIMLTLVSGFLMNILGFHPMIGGLMVGIIIPHKGGLAVKLAERIEDLILIIFLPLYFALTGLNLDIQLLNDASSWGIVILLVIVNLVGKVVGCAGAAKLTGMEWREALTVGFLMNCKGLVQLVALNAALNAGVIDRKVFAILMMMSLITIIITAPMAQWLYPSHYQRRLILRSRPVTRAPSISLSYTGEQAVSMNILLCVTRMRQVSGTMQLLRMLKPFSADKPRRINRFSPTASPPSHNHLQTHTLPDFSTENNMQHMFGNTATSKSVIHLLRLLELGQRNSTLMKYQQAELTVRLDPVVNVLQAFAELNRISTRGAIMAASDQKFASAVAAHAASIDVDTVVIMWS